MQAENKNTFQWLLVLGVLGFLIFSFVTTGQEPRYKDEDIKRIKIAGEKLNVELALTPIAQAQGLSYRDTLSEKDGMLFVFEEPGNYPFWMKDMHFPIDIIWIGEDMRVLFIKEKADPDSYPESFYPNQKTKYVLETVAGFSKENKLEVGDRVEFDY